MMKKIVFTNKDGKICIVYPAPKEDLQRVLGPLTEKEYEDHVRRKSIPVDATNISDINDEQLPQDRCFRNAWCHCPENKIKIDMDRARDIHMSKIRKLRDRRLSELDIETMKGRDVQVEKQVLRDLPQNFDLMRARTPEELKALWPEELKWRE